MRRKDRAMDEDFALEVIDKAAWGTLSLTDGKRAYGIPLSMVRLDKTLYFHCAMEGEKLDFIEAGYPVSVVFASDVVVPNLYDEPARQALLKDPQAGRKATSRVFTTEFASAMAKGSIRPVDTEEEKIKALKAICLKYTPEAMDLFPLAIESGLAITRVFAIEMEEITGKRKKFDAAGQEMKFGRRS